MNRISISTAFLALVLSLNACLAPMESEMDKIVERDDQVLQAYMAQHDITAQKTQVGYYYKKELEQDGAAQITNNSIVGIYYTIKNIDGQVIDAYTPEDGEPRLFLHGEAGLVPRVINFAASLAREGESIRLFTPSYLAYGNYGFQQLILPNSNLDITVQYAKIYTVEEMRELEDQKIQQYIAANNLEGFTKMESGAYRRVLEQGDTSTEVTKDLSLVRINYELFHLSESEPFNKASSEEGASSIIVGNSTNLRFVNLALLGVHKLAEVEIIAPSNLAYGATTQVVPYIIREDLVQKELIRERARPFEPVRFVASVKKIQ